MNTRKCVACSRELPMARFNMNRALDDHYSPVCRSCERVRRHNYLAKSWGAAATLTVAEWEAKVDIFGGRCAYCGSAPSTDLDHLVDLRFGGGTTIENCFPVCHPCNLRKQSIDARMGMLAAPEPFRSKNGRPHPFLHDSRQIDLVLPCLVGLELWPDVFSGDGDER